MDFEFNVLSWPFFDDTKWGQVHFPSLIAENFLQLNLNADRWSSYAHNALGIVDPKIVERADYRRLVTNSDAQRSAYRNLVAEGLVVTEIDALRAHTQHQRAYGNDAFRDQIEALTNRVVYVRPRGRPKTCAAGSGSK